MFGRKPEAAPPKPEPKKTFVPSDFNITPGRWYYAKNFPSPITHRQLQGVKFDVITKRYDAQLDEFIFERWPDVAIKVFHLDAFKEELAWSWGKDIDLKTHLVLAFSLPPDWKTIFFRHVTELVQ